MSKTLGSYEVGSIVKLREAGVLAEFFVAKHNYESALNGAGRVLLVRKGGRKNTTFWNSLGNNAYATSKVDTWLNGDYKKELDQGVQELLGKTRFYYTPGDGIKDVSTISRSVFLLSLAELDLSSTGANTEGTALPIAAELRAEVETQWTRSASINSRDAAYYAEGDKAQVSVVGGSFGIVPAFTLPQDTEVDDNGKIIGNRILANIPVEKTVKIKENGKLVEFYVAKHNYESALNGAGRTLLLRKEHEPAAPWNENGINTYADSTIDTWFNNDYLMRFDTNVREAIGKTKIYCTEGNGRDLLVILQRPVFALSLIEHGLKSASNNEEGTCLGLSDEILFTASSIWTRTPATNLDYVAFSVTEDGKLRWENVTGTRYPRPAFTLPEDTAVDEDGVVTIAILPEIQSEVQNGSDLGTIDVGMSVAYTVARAAEEEPVSVTEYLDGVGKYAYQAAGENEIACLNEQNFYKIPNGTHTITVVSDNGRDQFTYTITFTKKVTKAVISMEEAMEADDRISVLVANIIGTIPPGADVSFLVTNNGNDQEPIWEDATEAVLNGESFLFANQTAENGYAFNFKLTVNRGPDDIGGFITGIGGAFQ